MSKLRQKRTEKKRNRFPLIAFISGRMEICAGILHFVHILVFLFLVHTTFSQDLRFTQVHASDTWVNPAFAGIKGQPRLEINFRDQWPAIPQTYVSYRLAFDASLEFLNSGVGLFAVKDDEGQSILKTTNFGVQYSYQAQLSKRLALNIGVQGSYIQRSIDWAELQFYDQINPVFGFTDAAGNTNVSSQIPPSSPTIQYYDFSAGALLFSNIWYLG
ncbi:MAG: PorP/SprF family type IX secretion system membrane protein, partial [Chitinophagales bacterium]|nr:PorP/SprF family type IX secretion system membrane protein [Chitinophagales bacterium]